MVIMLKKLRRLLYPFSVVYGWGTSIRNNLYDSGKYHSVEFTLPVISVGNLSTGGTGKTPMIEYLIQLLGDSFQLATLSRGYKRKTTGFVMADEKSTAATIGDEPMQIHSKFPKVNVVVCEDRLLAIPEMLRTDPGIEVILLDDAYQHRRVKPGLSILLTDYNNLYTRDILLPAGNLRESAKGSSRADIIVVTKCNTEMTESEKSHIIKELNPLPHQKVFFTKTNYGVPYHFSTGEKLPQNEQHNVFLFSGIANPQPLEKEIASSHNLVGTLTFGDHHAFSKNDIDKIKARFDSLNFANKILITTEKDAVRLRPFSDAIQSWPLYILPVDHSFLFDEGGRFDNEILLFCEGFNKAV